MGAYVPVPRRETIRLIRQARRGGEDGRAAMQTLCEQNRGLVLSVVQRYDPAGLPAHVSAADLEAEGMLGLMRAVAKFDPRRGTQFSTYAVPWIRQRVQRFLEEQAPLSVSVFMTQRRKRVEKAAARIAARTGRKPGADELAAATGLKPRQVRAVRDLPTVVDGGFDPERGFRDPAELVPDPAQLLLLDSAGSRADQSKLLAYLETVLPARYSKVLAMLAGLHPGYPQGLTMAQIAAKQGVSRQRVAQMIAEAADTLRQPRHAAPLLAMLRGSNGAHPPD